MSARRIADENRSGPGQQDEAEAGSRRHDWIEFTSRDKTKRPPAEARTAI
jgi:hypothetical protein